MQENSSLSKNGGLLLYLWWKAEKHSLPTEMLFHFIHESGNLELKAAELHGQHGKNLFYVGAAVRT